MNSEIKITYKLRPCKYKPFYIVDPVNVLFHCWNGDGLATVEFKDGKIEFVDGRNIRFCDSNFNEFRFD